MRNIDVCSRLVKAVSKELVTRMKKISQVFREKDILARLTDCPYAMKLYCTFQDERTLCTYRQIREMTAECIENCHVDAIRPKKIPLREEEQEIMFLPFKT